MYQIQATVCAAAKAAATATTAEQHGPHPLRIARFLAHLERSANGVPVEDYFAGKGSSLPDEDGDYLLPIMINGDV